MNRKPEHRRWRPAVVLLALLCVGCGASIRGTTVPKMETVPGEIELGVLVGGVYDEAARNQWIEINVIRIDREFDDYRRHLQAWRTWTDVGAQTIGLFANIASSLTPSSGVKANYVALNSLVTGIDGIADREQFMEQTVDALVSAMEGRRAQVYTRLRTGMARPHAQYRLIDAHRDVLAYSAAGRLEEGMSFVVEATNEAARDAEAASARAIQDIVVYSADEQQVSQCATDAIRDLAATAQGRDTLAALADEFDVPYQAGDDAAALRRALLLAKTNQPASYQSLLLAALRKRGFGTHCPGT